MPKSVSRIHPVNGGTATHIFQIQLRLPTSIRIRIQSRLDTVSKGRDIHLAPPQRQKKITLNSEQSTPGSTGRGLNRDEEGEEVKRGKELQKRETPKGFGWPRGVFEDEGENYSSWIFSGGRPAANQRPHSDFLYSIMFAPATIRVYVEDL